MLVKKYNITIKAIFIALIMLTPFSVSANHLAQTEIGDPVIYLDQETTIENRYLVYRNFTLNLTLATVLNYHTHYCEQFSMYFPPKRQLRKFKRCLRHKTRKLRYWRLISRSEKRELIQIIRHYTGEEPAPTSTLDARITTPDGAVVEGINVSASNADNSSVVTSVSDMNGSVSLQLMPNTEYLIRLTGDDYADQIINVKTPAENGTVSLDFTVITRGQVQTVDASTGGTLTGDDGASVVINPGSFVDANGNPVSGTIDVTITPVDVSNDSTLGAFPGEFTGIQTDNTETPIISFGTVEYEFNQNGEPLQLASGQTAQILIPVYIPTYQDGTLILAGDTIPLWFLNESTGIWEQEGEGLIVESNDSPTGLAMQATVSHFSWWNCDVSMNAAQAIVTVTGSQAGTAEIFATTTANIAFRPSTVSTITEIGVPTEPLFIPSNGEVCFTAEINYADGSSATTLEECLTAAPNSVVNVTLIAPDTGALNIVANNNEGPITVNGFVDFTFNRIRLSPTTSENSVTYNIITGTLPDGLSLNQIDATRAEIVGTPTLAGSFNLTIEGVDSTNTETDLVVINIEISSDVPPPALPNFLNLSVFQIPESIDLNMSNTGGAATNWEEVPWPGNDFPLPQGTTLSSDGILTITEFGFGCLRVRASNASGTSNNMDVCVGDIEAT